MRKASLLFAGLVCMVLSSCNFSSSDNDIQYFPFQSKADGKWGMVSADGTKVICENEFDNMPTTARNGRFIVENEDGKYEIYTTDDTPQRVGETYIGICGFTQDVTPAVQKGKSIALIDKDGNEKVVLDRIDGKKVTRVYAFDEKTGLAQYLTTDGCYGIINTSGDVVVPAKYDNVINFNNCIVTFTSDDDAEGGSRCVCLDLSGSEKFKFDYGKYSDFKGAVSGDYIAVAKTDGDVNKWGIIGMDGEDVIHPTSKIREITSLHGDNFIFSDGEKYGLMNVKEDVIIKAKYNAMYFVNDDVIAAQKESDGDYVLMGVDGNRIGNESFKDHSIAHNGVVPVQTGENSWEFMNVDGTFVKGSPDIYSLGFNDGEEYVMTDNVTCSDIAECLELTAQGFLGLDFNSTPSDCASILGTDASAGDFLGETSVDFSDIDILGVKLDAGALYSDYVATYNHNDETSQWSDLKPMITMVIVKCQGRFAGKGKEMYDAIKARLNKFGKSSQSINRGIVIQTADGVHAAVGYSDNAVAVIYIGKSSEMTMDNMTSFLASEIQQISDISGEAEEEESAEAEDEYDGSMAVDSVAVEE